MKTGENEFNGAKLIMQPQSEFCSRLGDTLYNRRFDVYSL